MGNYQHTVLFSFWMGAGDIISFVILWRIHYDLNLFAFELIDGIKRDNERWLSLEFGFIHPISFIRWESSCEKKIGDYSETHKRLGNSVLLPVIRVLWTYPCHTMRYSQTCSIKSKIKVTFIKCAQNGFAISRETLMLNAVVQIRHRSHFLLQSWKFTNFQYSEIFRWCYFFFLINLLRQEFTYILF